MAANKFILKGSGIEVDYTIGITPGLPALIYKGEALERSFTSEQILSDDTGLGKLISIPLNIRGDTGGERFGFFLPFIEVTGGQPAVFHTYGIYETFTGPDSVPHRPSTWRCVELAGTAQNVLVE